MRAHIQEHEGCFTIDVTAETLAEAALLVRIARDATKDIRHFSTTPHKNGESGTFITLGKRRRSRAMLHVGGKA